MSSRLLRYLPRGNTLTDEAWRHRHRIVLWVLGVHVPGLLVFALLTRASWEVMLESLVVPLGCLVAASMMRGRRPASITAVVGLTWCSAALVVITGGSIEAHFHFFIIIGFIALYQDWIPFLWNIVFTVVSHGVGSALPGIKIFNHPSAQASPWLWSAIHGGAVLCACIGLVIFWWVNEQERWVRDRLADAHQAAEAEIRRRRFTSDLLVNLSRRNQSMLYRQLEIINQLEHKERDPDALAELFRLDHLATRIRRNAENLMVLSGDEPARTWGAPVALREVVQAAIAETEDLERVRFKVDELLMVSGHIVTDLTHLIAELTENAVRFSPPESRVTLGCRPLARRPGAQLLTIEDWGVGMPDADLDAANELLAEPPDVDLSVAQRLGFHVVSRLADRHSIEVSLTRTPGNGITAVVVLPADLFSHELVPVAPPVVRSRSGGWAADRDAPARLGRAREVQALNALLGVAADPVKTDSWNGWWDAGGWDGSRNGQLPAVRDLLDLSPPAPAEPPPAADPRPRPSPRPRGAATPAGPPIDSSRAAAEPRLSQRRPQTHLAPELLKPATRPAAPAPQVPDPRPASEALSRYQASRRAAQDDSRHGPVDRGAEHRAEHGGAR